MAAPFAAAFADLRGKRYPYVLVASVISFVIVGVVLLTAGIGQPTTTVDDPTTAAVQGTGGLIAPTPQEQWFVPFLPVLGALIVVAAVVLFVGYGWARLALAVLGILGVIGLAEAAQWQAVPAALFLVVGALLSLLLPAHRYLARTTGRPAEPTGSV